MIGRTAARVGLVVLAALAAAWLAYDLRAVSLDAQGRADARVAHRESQVDRALSLFAQAARANADPTPRIDQARLLLAIGRTGQAADVLDRVVRTNPGNVQAWSLLESATATSDPRRAAQAENQLRVLFGHPVIYNPLQGWMLTGAGVAYIGPGVIGRVESVRVTGSVAQFSGWLATATKPPGSPWSVGPADEILIVSDGRLVGGGLPTVTRPDISRAISEFLRASTAPEGLGFRIYVPLALLKRVGRKADLHVFGISQRIASALSILCSPSLPTPGCVR
jgi:hypothetical protein